MPSDFKKAYTAALTQTLIIGLSFVFIKVALRYAGALDILAHRFTISLLAALLLVVTGVVRLKIDWRRDLPSLLPLAVFYPSLFFSFQAYGLTHTTSSEAGIIQAAAPIFTTVLAAAFLGERVGLWRSAMILLSVGGVLFIFLMQGMGLSADSLSGNILILLSALSLSAYNVIARKVGQEKDIFSMTFVMLLIGALVFNVLTAGSHSLRGTLGDFFQPLASWQFTGSLLYLGVLSSLLTAYLSNYALSKIEASQMSLFFNLATLVTIAAGVLLLGERLHWYHLAGAAAILLGLIGSNLSPDRRKSPAR